MKCPQCSCLNKKSGRCEYCGFQMTEEQQKKIYRIPKKSKKQMQVTDEDTAFFKEIWATRPHYSEVSGAHLGEIFDKCFFSHILTKSAYPRFRHYEKNILLMSFDEHQAWEFSDRKDPKWNEARDLAEELIIEYYNPPIV